MNKNSQKVERHSKKFNAMYRNGLYETLEILLYNAEVIYSTRHYLQALIVTTSHCSCHTKDYLGWNKAITKINNELVKKGVDTMFQFPDGQNR